MVSEVILAPERLAADVTAVRAFVRVCALVNEQVVRLGEMATAELTDELLLRPETLHVNYTSKTKLHNHVHGQYAFM